MKKILLFLMALWAFNASAQDVIVKKDGSTILSKVLKITTTEVEYKKFTNQNGPTYTIPKTEIQAINYENGEKETFGEVKAEGEKQATQQQTVTPSITNPAPKVSDQQLLAMAGEYKYMDKELKAKKLRKAGWILLSAGAAVGLFGLSAGLYNYNDLSEFRDEAVSWTYTGIAFLAVGTITGTVCLLRAKELRESSSVRVQVTPLIEKDFALRNSSSLSTGVDVLSDSRLHTQTVGLGLRYTF